MKKIKILSLITAVLLSILCLFGCGKKEENTSSQETAKTHTISSREETASELEWGSIGCDTLTVTDSNEDGGNVIFEKTDFKAFAFDYIEKDDYYGFTFKLNDDAAKTLEQETAQNKPLYVWVNGKLFEQVITDEQITNGEFMTKPVKTYTYEEYCEWANEIRGL